MRHGDKVNNLGRTASHRRALMANLAIALITHKRITTTLAKARALRRYVEPLVTKSKDNSTHSRRVVFGYLQDKKAVTELFSTIAERIADRPGGYLRVIKLGFRRGDGAETAMIEFVDFNELYNPNAGKTRTSKKTRRGRAGSGAPKANVAETPAVLLEEPAVAESTFDSYEPEVETPAPVYEAVETVVEETPAPVVEAVVEAAAEPVVESVTETVADTVDAVETVAEEAVAEATETAAEAAGDVADAANGEEKKEEEA